MRIKNAIVASCWTYFTTINVAKSRFVLNISKCIRVYAVDYEKINMVGKVLLKAGRSLILWTENIKQKCFPVNGRAIDEKVLSLCEPRR